MGGDEDLLILMFLVLVFGLACIVSRSDFFNEGGKTEADERGRWTWSPGSAWPAGG